MISKKNWRALLKAVLRKWKLTERQWAGVRRESDLAATHAFVTGDGAATLVPMVEVRWPEGEVVVRGQLVKKSVAVKELWVALKLAWELVHLVRVGVSDRADLQMNLNYIKSVCMAFDWSVTPWLHQFLFHVPQYIHLWGSVRLYSTLAFEASFRMLKSVASKFTTHVAVLRNRHARARGRSGLGQLLVLYNVWLALLKQGLVRSDARLHRHVGLYTEVVAIEVHRLLAAYPWDAIPHGFESD